MSIRGMHIVVCAIAAAAAVACGGSSPTTPAAPLTGTWSGTVTDAVAGAGTASVVITQNGAGLAGSWTFVFASEEQRTGSLGGTTTDSSLSLFLTPSEPIVCPASATLTGTLGATGTVMGTRLTASYTAFTCTGVDSGTLDLSLAGPGT